ncbi:hypothetical protein RY27_01730 [Litorilinea aerophila]|nr:hypothetical protein RY27_01730 [Litorilinea aerophila]
MLPPFINHTRIFSCIFVFTFGPDSLKCDFPYIRIRFRFVFRKLIKLNYPAGRLLLGMAVQVFAVQVEEETIRVARILCQQVLGFIGL